MQACKKALQIHMARACMNTQELAKVAELPPQTVNGVIRGRSVRPATLGKVARALGCDPVDLLDDSVDTSGYGWKKEPPAT